MAKTKVVLTGACGRIGSALWPAWEDEDRYDLTLVDLNPVEGARSRVEVGDLQEHAFASHVCADQDVLISLARLQATNVGEADGGMTDIGMQMQLFEIAHRAGVGKIIYASSNHASGWNEKISDPPVLSTVDQINPDGWYGAMKCMAEAAGKYLVNVCDRRFIAFRIGTFHGTSEPESLRRCSTLLAPVDAVQLFSLAVDYEGPEKFVLAYGASENVYGENSGFLDLSDAKEILGYKPEVNMMSFRHKFDE
jgi:uronate dehydrogenase